MTVNKETEAYCPAALDLDVKAKRIKTRQRQKALRVDLRHIYCEILAEPIPQVLVDRMAAIFVETP